MFKYKFSAYPKGEETISKTVVADKHHEAVQDFFDYLASQGIPEDHQIGLEIRLQRLPIEDRDLIVR